MSKLDDVTNAILEILNEHSESGISKNGLIQMLIKKKISSRETFYSFYKEGRFARIFEERGDGKYQKLYPTNSTKNLTIFKSKLQKLEKLLDFMEKWDYGDLVENPKDVAKNLEVDYKKFEFWLHYNTHFEDTTDIDHTYKIKRKKKTGQRRIYSVMGRHDLLKNLPLFLTSKVSEYVKDEESNKEYFLLIQPIIIRTLKLLKEDYVRSNLVAEPSLIHFLRPDEKISLQLKINLVTGISDPNINSNFLKVLGRYYFSIATSLSKNMQLESSREQKIVSDVIKEFYSKNTELENITEITDWQKFIAAHESHEKMPDKLHEEFHQIYDHSIGGRMIELSENIKNNDPYFLRNYYIELFQILDIFTEPEIKIICFHDQKMRERENEIEQIK